MRNAVIDDGGDHNAAEPDAFFAFAQGTPGKVDRAMMCVATWMMPDRPGTERRMRYAAIETVRSGLHLNIDKYSRAIQMDQDVVDDNPEDGPRYRRPDEIDPREMGVALDRLALFGDDHFLTMQAFNLGVVDEFATRLEYELLGKLFELEVTPVPEATFLLAQSQMWIFAAYELMRTWRARVQAIAKWHTNGGLELKIKALEKDMGYQHFAREQRADQLRRVLADPSIVDTIKKHLALTHVQFARLSAIRVSIAKHEVKGRDNSVALSPGYGRINQWCGSLDFELENEVYSMGYISRRDIADGIRAIDTTAEPPTPTELKEFDAYMRGQPA